MQYIYTFLLDHIGTEKDTLAYSLTCAFKQGDTSTFKKVFPSNCGLTAEEIWQKCENHLTSCWRNNLDLYIPLTLVLSDDN